MLNAALAEPITAAEPASATTEALSVADLRAEIDRIDDALLELVEQRQALARRVGTAKGGDDGRLRLKPDREAAVVERLVRKAQPWSKRLVAALWRELMSAGLSTQSEVEVVVWAGADPARRLDAARRRFGSSADYRLVATAQEALDAAEQGGAVAVLAVEPDAPWWTDLPEREDLWIFDALHGPRAAEPTALAVGRVSENALARGQVFRISTGGDGDDTGARPRLVAMDQGVRLYAVTETSAATAKLDRARGYVGRCSRALA
ncbi:chorismate mutase [Caulobacter sp. 17J80-11]|uniref:chorismate mutase n=1 Tax=Caulobacter sp. 17J80-11 TaxID=2763502 RepID=UPI001653665A|nr:chorismate mutase [Caulobacter sp. 17J80-11]MBC6981734.1 chorismate mutase [Caulobacter sp. 17J80-11]